MTGEEQTVERILHWIRIVLLTLGTVLCVAGCLLLSLPFYGLVLWHLFLPVALVGSGLVGVAGLGARRSLLCGCCPYSLPLVCQGFYIYLEIIGYVSH